VLFRSPQNPKTPFFRNKNIITSLKMFKYIITLSFIIIIILK